MIVRPCRASTSSLPVWKRHGRPFTTSRVLLASPATHYDTLGIPFDASQGEVKKQFYALSKSHHPDLHPTDPDASTKFMALSEAYHVLGDAARRTRYDRSIQPASASSSSSTQAHPPPSQGSYHSSAGPGGARPASGLSRRRTQFRGPPPSFYQSGGWGAHSTKRQDAASAGRREDAARSWSDDAAAAAAAAAAAPGGSWTQATEPGTGPGGFRAGWDNDVPHFDRDGHFRTHERVERTRHRSRTWTPPRADDRTEERPDVEPGGGAMAGFLGVMGVLGMVLGINAVISGLPSANAPPRRGRLADSGGEQPRRRGSG